VIRKITETIGRIFHYDEFGTWEPNAPPSPTRNPEMEDRNAMPTEAMKQIEEAIEAHWGDRCPDFDADCACCQAWAEYDRLSSAALAHPGQVREIAIKPLTEALAFYAEAANWEDGHFVEDEPNTLTLVSSTIDQDRGDKARSALALPLPVQEPVAWQILDTHGRWITLPGDWDQSENVKGREYRPLYLSPSPSIPEEKGGTAESVGVDLVDTIKEWGRWHHLNEMTIAAGKTPSDSEIDIEVIAWNKIKRSLAAPVSEGSADV
jgi:hypothetical protein